jgi:hypothetical protein
MSDQHRITLVSSPGDDYFQALENALLGATNVTLITAFATTAGMERLLRPFLVPQTLGLLHAKALMAIGPGGTTLVVGVRESDRGRILPQPRAWGSDPRAAGRNGPRVQGL